MLLFIKKNLSFVKRKYGDKALEVAEYIKWFVALCSIFAIVTIQLTEWRPLGSASRHEAINEIILNLSYSYLQQYSSILRWYIFLDNIAKEYSENRLNVRLQK